MKSKNETPSSSHEHLSGKSATTLKLNRGTRVVLAGFCINLAFGVLYAWSLFSKQLVDGYHWQSSEAALPYTVAIVFFAFTMLPAGFLQDRFGARRIVTLGGLLTGIGLIISGLYLTPFSLCLSFGMCTGMGIGLGYASATPIAIKWFAAERKGFITGIVVAGFGLSTLYMAPLANYLITAIGLANAFKVLGIAFLIIVTAFAQSLIPPPSVEMQMALPKPSIFETLKARLSSPQFYLLWFTFLCGALGGLMIIGHLSKIVALQSGQNFGFVLVACTAIFNASGRPIAGLVSDRLGKYQTLIVLFVVEAMAFFSFDHFTTFVGLLFGAAIITFCYGSLFAIMPSLTSDYFGKATLGTNYGLLFTAWGAAGIIGPILAGRIVDATGQYTLSYLMAGMLCIIGGTLSTFALLLERKKTRALSV